MSPILCSDCFSDFGLKQEAIRLGKESTSSCPNCKSTDGNKLEIDQIESLATAFFVTGSRSRAYYGSANILQCNEYHYKKNEVNFWPRLIQDVRLIEDALNKGFFYYGPPMWQVGEVEPLKNLLGKSVTKRDKAIEQIFDSYPRTDLKPSDSFFRLRLNPSSPHEPIQFDSPPAGKGQSRFNKDGYPTLYGSQNLEICLHECRATIPDELYVAHLHPTKVFQCLDLSANISEDVTPFESLSLAVHFLLYAEAHSYRVLTLVAEKARDIGLHGIIFPSYFSQIKTERIPNIAVFGNPVASGDLLVESINRVHLETATYEYSFGPTFE